MGIISDLIRQRSQQKFQQAQQQGFSQDIANLQQFSQFQQQKQAAESQLAKIRALPLQQRQEFQGPVPSFPAFVPFPRAQSAAGGEEFSKFLLAQQGQAGRTALAQAKPPPRETESQFRAREGQRIQDIPPEQRTVKEQKRLDDIFSGRPLVQVQLPGEQRQAAKEQIGILRDLQTAANEFNAEGISPNFEAIIKTDTKGQNIIALEPKTKPTSEERNQEVLLTAVRESMKNIAEVATAKRVGPIQGRLTSIKAELIGSDPSGAELISELNSLILFVYGLSGKQVNETEFKILGNLMPKITNPDSTFTKRYNTFLRRLKTISGIRDNIWNQIGISQINKQARPGVDIRTLSDAELEKIAGGQ